jgi:hypothetical protein
VGGQNDDDKGRECDYCGDAWGPGGYAGVGAYICLDCVRHSGKTIHQLFGMVVGGRNHDKDGNFIRRCTEVTETTKASKIIKITPCSICKSSLRYERSNNAWPINDGRCCKDCNTRHVIPARILLYKAEGTA